MNQRVVGGRAPTLKEIAERAEVHVSTVSRVLRQSEPPDGWSESAQRIKDIAAELGYQPNLAAASLRTRRSMTIGLVMPRLTDGVIATMFEGVEISARAAGYSVLLSSPQDDMDAQRAAIELLASRQVDGLLLSSLHRGAEGFLESLNLGQLPIVVFNRHADLDVPSVTCDDRAGGRLAAEHLIELGHRRVGIVAGPEHASTAHDRVVGFLEAAASAKIKVRPKHIVRSGFGVQAGITAGHAMLRTADRPTAVFTVDDTSSIGMLGAARDLALSVPDDLSLVGYNDIPIVGQLPTPLTSMRSPVLQMGALAFEKLLNLIEGGRSESLTLPVELVARASSGPPHRAARV
ncbi:LacI family transcriptional regulator [Nocardioides sp. S5]|uniref:LacI family DNA-binding transcriptional regulator n=1 Tax=Nocardioides sp. S5 TaxID=2017486 RepID=UPI001A8C4E5D|nr:LacI family DNA-binding transcriptional regulator [Nocardioides sp. S5]QSR29113.1 LacI family transcriptional regulator [Nocardioides sp. S5]